MSKRRATRSTSTFLLATGILVALFFSMTTSAKANSKGPKCLTIDTDLQKRKVKNFPHRLHQENFVQLCQTCHHKKPNVTETPCHNCHKEKKRKGVPAMRKAAHKMCKGCHEGKKATTPGSEVKGMDLDDCDVCHAHDRECMKP